jgi:drug/metabolite transporter (DMT)-like permease
MAFAIAFGLGLVYMRWKRTSIASILRVPFLAWVIGIGGLFGYHFLYFLAFRLAPAIEVNLLNYLWPLLIVLLSALLLKERLTQWHILGAFLGLLGSILVITHAGQVSIQAEFSIGYLAALGAAFVWSSYSVLSRRIGGIPTEMVGVYCGVTAVLAFGFHFIFEQTVVPQGTQWPLVLAMGIGPVGSAFYFWDFGVKNGDIRALAVGAYIIPFLSTMLLIIFGEGESSWYLWVAGLLIVSGAVLASRELLSANR